MKHNIMACLTVARRDFMAIVATPSFLLFLLGPLFFVGIGAASSLGSRSIANAADATARITVIMPADDLLPLREADAVVREGLPTGTQPYSIIFQTPSLQSEDYAATLNKGDAKLLALMHGTLAAPVILQRSADSQSAAYLKLLIEQATARQTLSAQPDASISHEIIPFPPQARAGMKFAMAKGISMGAISIIFLLTLLLATQSISSMAEEKSNKVIEVLAAAVPLEVVFIGKLLAMLGVGALFIVFWAALATLTGTASLFFFSPSAVATGQSGLSGWDPRDFAPAVGWASFGLLTLAYMVTNFLLYGSLFLGIGSLAATTREIQMLSFPITILQMIAYFIPLFNLLGDGQGKLQRFAEIFPFTSSYSMVARAAVEPGIGWHLIALGWQTIWVAIVIGISVRLFRAGVLGGEQVWKFWRRSTL